MAKLPPELIRYMAERRGQEAALGLRGYGRKRIVEALAEIDEALKDVVDPSVHNHDEEAPGLLDLLDHVVGVAEYEEIPGDRDAMDALENLASAIGIAFELGKAAVVGNADPAALSTLRAAAEARRQGARNSRVAPTKRAEEWKAVARRTMGADSGSSTDEKITKDICAELDKLRQTRSRRTVFNYVREMRKTAH
jgi:hypothetical protein